MKPTLIVACLLALGCGGGEQPPPEDAGSTAAGADAGAPRADAGAPGAPDASSDNGPLPCAAGLACPGVAVATIPAVTGLEVLNAWKSSLAGFADVRWLGGLQGMNVARDGTLIDTLPAGTFWQGNFCSPGNQFHFEMFLEPAACTVGRNCQWGACGEDVTHALPAVDTGAAILTAFPDDPADTKYAVNIVAALGRHWVVTRFSADGQSVTQKKVHADTGAIVP